MKTSRNLLLATLLVCTQLADLLSQPCSAATLTWTGAVSSDWQNPTNWSPALVPTAADTVNLNSGTVTATAGSQFGTLNLNGGTLAGSLSALGGSVVNWTSGTLGSPASLTVARNAMLNLSGSGTKYFYGALTNAGTVVWSGTGNLALYNNNASYRGAIVNLAGAQFDVQND